VVDGGAVNGPDANTIWTFREALTIGLRPIPRRDVSEADTGRRDRALVRALRPGAAGCRLSGDGWPARGCDHRRGAEAAQHQGREAGAQGGARPGRLGSQAGEAPPEGPRRALDREVHQGQARSGRRGPAGRHRDPGLRLPEPYQRRSALPVDPPLGGDRCRGACRCQAQRAPRSEQHGERRRGRHRLSQQEERGPARGADAQEPHPPQAATRPADAVPHHPRQRQAVGHPDPHRAHLRLPEGQDGPLHPLDRACPRHDQDRSGQSGLQHESPPRRPPPAVETSSPCARTTVLAGNPTSHLAALTAGNWRCPVACPRT
jgi:hypothetical protein